MVYTSVQEDPLLEYGRQALPDGLALENRGPSAFVYRGLDRGLVSAGSRTGGSHACPTGACLDLHFPQGSPTDGLLRTGSRRQALADRLSQTGSRRQALASRRALADSTGRSALHQHLPVANWIAGHFVSIADWERTEAQNALQEGAGLFADGLSRTGSRGRYGEIVHASESPCSTPPPPDI